MWCIGTLTGEYLANLEDVLDVYAQPAEASVGQYHQVVLAPPWATQRFRLLVARKCTFWRFW